MKKITLAALAAALAVAACTTDPYTGQQKVSNTAIGAGLGAIAGTGELIPYSDARVKDSPDGEYHWCSVAGKADGKTICLFVPPKAF